MVEDNLKSSVQVEQPSPEISLPEPEEPKIEEVPEGEKVEEKKAETEKPKPDEKKKLTPEQEVARKEQSEKDKKIAELSKQLEGIKAQSEVARRQQALLQLQQQHQQDLQRYGDTPELRTLHQRETETFQFQQFMQEASPKLGELAMLGKAYNLSKQYGVDMEELMKGKHPLPQDMEIAAIKLAAEKKVEEVRKPADFPTASQVQAGQESDADFVKRYASGDSDDHPRYWRIMNPRKKR